MRLLPPSRPLPPRTASRGLATLAAVAALALAPLTVVSSADAVAVDQASSAATSRPAAPSSAPSSARKGCVARGKAFRPTSLGIRGIITPRTVLALGRDARNVPKAPPLTDTGKRQFAWDAQDRIKAGSRNGVIKLNAHTYPDGSALGNTLINQLYAGNRMVVRGARGQVRCYDVVDRVQITAEKRFRRYYRTDGPGRLAIAVCSGVRRGPGDWSHRTIWFAKLVR